MRTSTLGRTIEAALMARDFRRLARATDEHARDEARRMLISRLGGLRGIPQKLGQAMSLSAQPENAAFETLTEQGEALPFSLVTQLLEQRWGQPWTQVLDSLEPEGLAASLGQVHRARLKDGREVAVKLAYPGIREAVMADLRIMGWLGEGARRVSGFGLQDYSRILLTDLEEELDYRIEAEQQQSYARMVDPGDPVVVPEVIAPFSGEQVLVTCWQSGSTLADARHWPEAERRSLGELLVRHFLRMLFDHGWVHADPHQGNYRFRHNARGAEVVLYDFGSVAKFPKSIRLGLLRLILASRQDYGDPFAHMVGLGFRQDLLEALRPKLPALCKLLFEPFLVQGRFNPGDWARGERIEALLGELRWNFRMSGPADFVFLVRGFQGLFYHLERLGVQVSFSHIFNDVIANSLAEALAMPLPKLAPGPGFETLAKHLYIRLSEAGETLVSLQFPANAVERLSSLIDEDVRHKIRQQGLELEQVVRSARNHGYVPGELLEFHHGKRDLKIWLA